MALGTKEDGHSTSTTTISIYIQAIIQSKLTFVKSAKVWTKSTKSKNF